LVGHPEVDPDYSRKVGFRAAICFSALIGSPEYTDSAD
jgi:hypothetical protein